jgi:hypothetical protein
LNITSQHGKELHVSAEFIVGSEEPRGHGERRRDTRSGVMTAPPSIGDADCAPAGDAMSPRRRAIQPGVGLRPICRGSKPGGGVWVSRAVNRPGTPRPGWPTSALRANDWYGMISPGLITPSSIARASSASLLGAVRPVAAYLARARLMYCRTVFSLIDMRRATDSFDMPWNHSSSACRSCCDSAGRAGRSSASIALACDRVTYGRSAAAASTAPTRWSRPSSLDT